MNRGNATLALLLVFSLIWAYWLTHRSGAGSAQGEGAVWEHQVRDIESIEYRSGEHRVTLSARWTEGREEPHIWVQTLGGDEIGTKDDSREAARTFKGNNIARKMLDFLAAPLAKRRLGRLDDLDGKPLGLPNPERVLEVRLRGAADPLTLELGNDSFGGSMVFARFLGDNKVYLLPKTDVERPRRAGAQMMERKLLAVTMPQLERIEIAISGGSASLYQTDSPGKWAAALDQEGDDQERTRFAQALSRLNVLEYLAEGSGPQAVPGEVALEVRFFEPEKPEPVEWLKIWQPAADKAIGQSGFSSSQVELNTGQVEQLLQAARKISASL